MGHPRLKSRNPVELVLRYARIIFCVPCTLLFALFQPAVFWPMLALKGTVVERVLAKVFDRYVDWINYVFWSSLSSSGNMRLSCAELPKLETDRKVYVLLANHQSSADIPVIATFFNAAGLSHRVGWIMDQFIRKTPVGWASLIRGDTFILQPKNGGTVEGSLNSIEAGVRSMVARGRRIIVIFPEGGLLHKRHASSAKWAAANRPSLKPLTKVLYPRVLGALSAVKAVRQGCEECNVAFGGVIDFTISYAGPKQGVFLPHFEDLFGGAWERDVNVSARVIKPAEIPNTGSTEDFELWLYNVFARKEADLVKGIGGKKVVGYKWEFGVLGMMGLGVMSILIWWGIVAFYKSIFAAVLGSK